MIYPCLICGRYVLDGSEAIHFAVRNRVPIHVDLKGQEAWAGVRCVCTSCATFLGACAAQACKEEVS